MSANDASAAPDTTGAVPAADEMSTLTAALFAAHGELYVEVNAWARTIHDVFVSTLQAGASALAATESVNATIADT